MRKSSFIHNNYDDWISYCHIKILRIKNMYNYVWIPLFTGASNLGMHEKMLQNLSNLTSDIALENEMGQVGAEKSRCFLLMAHKERHVCWFHGETRWNQKDIQLLSKKNRNFFPIFSKILSKKTTSSNDF